MQNIGTQFAINNYFKCDFQFPREQRVTLDFVAYWCLNSHNQARHLLTTVLDEHRIYNRDKKIQLHWYSDGHVNVEMVL